MNHLNSILIEGNLTADPALAETPDGTQVCSFAIASERYIKRDESFEKQVSFFDIVSWGRLAESCAGGLTKGRGVRVVGRLTQDRWESDGVQHSRVKIIAEHVEFRPLAARTERESSEEDDPLRITP